MFSKGQTFIDVITLLFFLFVIGVSVIIGLMVTNNLNDEIQADTDMSAEAQNASQGFTDNYPGLFDKLFLFFLFLFWIFLIVSSFLIDTHPIFFAVSIILLLFVFGLSMIMGNAYEEVAADSELTTYAAEFPIMNWVMSNILIVSIIIGFTTALALYAKNKL